MLWQLDRRYSDWRRKFGLPNKEVLLERLLPTVKPAVEAAGFPHVADDTWGSHEKRVTFARRGEWGEQCFELIAVDSPEWFYGVRVRFSVHIPDLYKAICAEKRADMAHADWIIDLGPGAGHDGGTIVFDGTPADLVATRSTLTGEHLAAYVGSRAGRARTR